MKIKERELQIVYDTLYDSKTDADNLVLKSSVLPTLDNWKEFLVKLSISMGALQLLAGIIFFFAYNWTGIHRFGKLGIVASLIIVAAGVAIGYSKNSAIYKVSLMSMAVLTGVILALWGQIYQTGADSYQLFMMWAILVTPIIVIAKSPFTWALWVILLNLAIVFHSGQIMRLWFNPVSAILIIALNGCAILVFEKVKSKKTELKKSTWFISIFTLFALSWLTIGSIWAIISEENYFLVLLNLLSIIAVFLFYFFKVHSLGQLALAMLSLITVIFTLFIRFGDFSEAGYFLMGGFILIGLVAATLKILLIIKKYWEGVENE